MSRPLKFSAPGLTRAPKVPGQLELIGLAVCLNSVSQRPSTSDKPRTPHLSAGPPHDLLVTFAQPSFAFCIFFFLIHTPLSPATTLASVRSATPISPLATRLNISNDAPTHEASSACLPAVSALRHIDNQSIEVAAAVCLGAREVAGVESAPCFRSVRAKNLSSPALATILTISRCIQIPSTVAVEAVQLRPARQQRGASPAIRLDIATLPNPTRRRPRREPQ